jgi:hypothetical protein
MPPRTNESTDGGSGIRRRGMAGEDEDARADDVSDSERNQTGRRQRSPERNPAMRCESLDIGFLSLGQQQGHRFFGPKICHGNAPR